MDLETVWTAIGARYETPGLKDRLILAQDSDGADVSLMLLLDWLEQAGLMPRDACWADLIALSQAHQMELGEQRSVRRALKGQPGYAKALAKELDLERAALADYLETIDPPAPQNGNAARPLDRYLSYMPDSVETAAVIRFLRQTRSSV